MKNLYNIFILIVLLFSSQTSNSQDDILKKINEIATLEQKVMMPMRDGIRLATDIYRPKTDEKVPIIFSRTPYNFNSWGDGEEKNRTHQRAYEALKRGYAYVVQNERGRYFSEGQWDILGMPLTDGYDAFSWMSEQTWSNGKIGTLGCSSTAEWQMAVAALESLGMLFNFAENLNEVIPNLDIVIALFGIGSAIIDNVPLVAASMGMFSQPIDDPLWHLIAYSAGTGGSMLIIGSAAGVVAMGMEKIDFFWYLKKIAWLAFAGFISGFISFILLRDFVL